MDSKLRDIIEPLVAQTLLQRPKNVAKFMLNWLKKTYNRTASSDLKEDSEKDQSNDVTFRLIFQEDEEEITPIPPPTKKKVGPRKSVSAEVYGAWNKKEEFQPRVIEKTEEQRERILEKLKTSFIFNALDRNELEIVADAMEEKKFAKDETIMSQGEEGNELYIVDSGTLSCSRTFVSLSYNWIGSWTRAEIPQKLSSRRSIWRTRFTL